MNADNGLLKNLDKLHTTELGVERIKRNLSLDTDDVVEWCKTKINSANAVITRKGKNWYVNVDNYILTVNAYSYTIIVFIGIEKIQLLKYGYQLRVNPIWRRL